ncbi:hypothetical protein DUNSADRAFT_17044 [Dunaliella salina]|uniref:Uncharacterized protein n=1 Tax=Dunaliella salina TaxID=3046 RepID=A0ABQ7H0I0_DUNSA|nr:hypothetical protein DUNSADRAFT_17044 [Dunaliella salina]|eukprot:KAF5840347.1 hypothetical protein DUNSADRAFT_17044 [Dunaliella salina]
MAIPQEPPKEIEISPHGRSGRSTGPGLTTRRSKNSKGAADDSEPPLEQLPASQDWVHWLYLQPPRGAEVLVQACGRTFITTWNQQAQQWGTRELPQDHDGLSLPHLLPKIVEVTPSCLLLPPPPPSRPSDGCTDAPAADAAAPSNADVCEQVVHLSGPNLRAPGVRITARFHGRSLQTKLLAPSSPSGPLLQLQPHQQQHSHHQFGPYQDRSHQQQHYQGYYHQQQGVSGVAGKDPNDVPLAILGVDQPGMLLLECWHGSLLTGRKQVVVLDDPQVVGELNNQVVDELSNQVRLSPGKPWQWAGTQLKVISPGG